VSDAHREAILDQFTRQAVPFATAPSIRDEAALRTVVDGSGAGRDDTVLDVACGPGILACAFARVARHVTGIDLTKDGSRGYGLIRKEADDLDQRKKYLVLTDRGKKFLEKLLESQS